MTVFSEYYFVIICSIVLSFFKDIYTLSRFIFLLPPAETEVFNDTITPHLVSLLCESFFIWNQIASAHHSFTFEPLVLLRSCLQQLLGWYCFHHFSILSRHQRGFPAKILDAHWRSLSVKASIYTQWLFIPLFIYFLVGNQLFDQFTAFNIRLTSVHALFIHAVTSQHC